MKIVVIGSINMDLVMRVNRLPQKGETITAENYFTVPGGKGANQAVAAARLGADVFMVGALGKDGFGEELFQHIEKEGIDVEGICRTDGPTGNALITVDQNGDNTILVYPGANHEVTPEWIQQQEKLIEKSDWVMLQLEIPMNSVVEAARIAKKFNKKVLLNPAPATVLPDELISLVDLLTPNETELALLSCSHNIQAGADILIQRGIGTVVVTLGDKGSMAYVGTRSITGAPYKVIAVDTTAAGDTFNAALVVALGDGKELEEALGYANAAGALATTRMGAQSSLPTKTEVVNFRKRIGNEAFNVSRL